MDLVRQVASPFFCQAASALSQLHLGVAGVERSEPPDRIFLGFRFSQPQPPEEVVANIVICLIRQANYLLDRQIRVLE